MKIRFIINPISGNGKQKGIEEIIKNNLKIDYDIAYTNKIGDATELSQKAITDKIDIVIVVGGDGTVNECAKALINSETSLGVIPCGSGNGFAYHFGINRNIEKAVKELSNSSISTIDSCTVNKLPFVNVSGIGFDAHVANLFNSFNKRGFGNYLKILVKELSYKPKKYKIKYDNNKKEVKAYLIAFANSSQYGNDFKISPYASTSDGLIDFVIIKNFPKWKIPFFLLQVSLGKVHLSKNVEIIQARKMQIESENGLIHLDGETKILDSPIIIKIHPKTLKVFTPNGEK